MRRAKFTGDWMDGTLPGFTTGQTWNGWAMPLFEFETVNKIIEGMRNDEQTLTYYPTRDAFVYVNPDWPEEPDVYAASFIEIDGRRIKVYGIGAGFWCWDEDK